MRVARALMVAKVAWVELWLGGLAPRCSAARTPGGQKQRSARRLGAHVLWESENR